MEQRTGSVEHDGECPVHDVDDSPSASARCEDYPCCGHTDGLPCNWTAPDYSKDPHLMCEHELGMCYVWDEENDDEYED